MDKPAYNLNFFSYKNTNVTYYLILVVGKLIAHTIKIYFSNHKLPLWSITSPPQYYFANPIGLL